MPKDRISLYSTATAMALLLASATSVSAQTEEAEQPQLPDLSTGEVITPDGEADSYVGNTHGDWELVCARVPDEPDPCQMYQLLRDAEGNATAEITMFPLPEGQEAAAGATILTPLETLLTAQLVMSVDGGQAKRYPFTFCTAIGCIARVGFTSEEVDAFRAGAVAQWSLVPVAAPDQVVELDMSLMGFTAAFAELTEQLEE